MTDENVLGFTQAIINLKKNIVICEVCGGISDSSICSICSDAGRDNRTICVVEEANDVLALERTGKYSGLYHVLGGALSPLDGIGPDSLRIKELMIRLGDDVKEVILATNPNAEGEATAIYLQKLIKPLGINVSRIARGIPVGADLEYADEVTLSRALEGRTKL